MEKRDTKVVILCGGEGKRIRDTAEHLPKPLINIGDKPILWHIMKIYSAQGYKNFVLCLGYKGHLIRDFFLNYGHYHNDIEIDMPSGQIKKNGHSDIEDWKITLVDTGHKTNTGLRLHKVRKYLEGQDYFMLTYGDGVSNVDLDKLISFHKSRNKIGTITGVRSLSKYGQVKTDEEGIINSFKEKPLLDDAVNGGFMVFNREFLDHPLLPLDVSLEEVLISLSEQKRLALCLHSGFWHSMDTTRDFEELNKIWDSGNVPWRIW